MTVLRRIVALICLISGGMYAMQEMNLDDEDFTFRDAYANELGVAYEHDFTIKDEYEMVHYAMNSGCMPLQESFATELPWLVDVSDEFKSFVKGNLFSRKLEYSLGCVGSVVLNQSGDQFATGCYSYARIWNVKDGRCIQTLKHLGSVNSVAFNQLGDRLATGCDDNKVLIWDLKNGRCIQTLKHRDCC